MSSRQARTGCLIAGAIIGIPLSIILIMVAVWVFSPSEYAESGYANPEKFSPTLWTARADSPPYRTSMIDDLLRHHHLKGKTEAEIDRLLGPTTGSGHFPDWDRAYWLGPERGFISIDSEWLLRAG